MPVHLFVDVGSVRKVMETCNQYGLFRNYVGRFLALFYPPHELTVLLTYLVTLRFTCFKCKFYQNRINTICPCKLVILRKFKMFENAAPGGCHISKEMTL